MSILYFPVGVRGFEITDLTRLTHKARAGRLALLPEIATSPRNRAPRKDVDIFPQHSFSLTIHFGEKSFSPKNITPLGRRFES